MTALLEKKILSALLDDLEIIKRLPLSVRWFEDQEHRQLADVLINSEKTYVDKSELLFDVKQKYPQSKLYLEWLEDLQFEFFETPYKELKGACKTLESEYVNRKVLKANQDYMNLPNLKNKQNLQDWLLRLDELSVEEDDGSLNTAIDEFQHEIEHGKEMGLSSFKQLDQLLGAGFEPNTLNVIGARPGVGKGHPNWLKIPTPNGDKKMGDIKVGDYVFDRNGQPTKVTGVYPRGILETYKVTLNDGRSTIVDGDHIWSYYGSRGNLTTKTTSEMYKTGAKTDRGRSRYAIPTNEPAHFKDKQHFIDPYVIGALIGDGSLLERALTISSNDVEVVEKVAELLNTTPRKQHENNFSWQFKLKESSGRRKFLRTKDVLADFPETATFSHMKEIPEEYLFTGLDNRMRLLNGLFDTDGSAVRTGNRLHVSYSTTSEKLAKQIRWLLQSCGYLSGLVLDEREGRNITYNVNVLDQAKRTKGLFTLPRKRKVVESFGRKKARNYDRIQIDKIEKTGNLEEITCISVENEEQLYLTNDFIVTHNTAFAINLVIEILKKTPDVQIDFFTLEMSKVQMLKRFTSRLTQINSYKFRDPEMTLTEDEVNQIFKAHDWITQTGLRIHDKCKKYHQIERMIRQRKLANKDKKYIAVIDYLGIIEPPNEQLPRHQQIGQMTRRLKNMTNDLMIPIIVLSQLNRGIEHRQDNRPNLADLRESGDVEQDASMIGFLFNKDADKDEYGVPHSDGRVIFNVAKNREGNVGDIEFEFIKNRMTFKEWLE